MKKMISALALTGALLAGTSVSAFGGSTDSAYNIRGYLPEQKNGKIYLVYRIQKEMFRDSAIVKDGRFAFKGFVQSPLKATLYSSFSPGEAYMNADFFLEPGTIIVMGYHAGGEVVIQGGQAQAEFLLHEKLMAPFKKRAAELISKRYVFKDNEDTVKTSTLALRKVFEETHQLNLEFIKRYPDSYVSWDLIRDATVVIDPEFMAPAMDAISPRLKGTKEGQEIAAQLEIAKRTVNGAPAMEIKEPDVNGKMVSLSSYRGKYVLIDFWASWCGPCRMENPFVVKAYEKYKNKGFTVLGVSLDTKETKDKWIAAIKADKLPWTHISDLQGMRKNAAAVAYGVRAIPQNFLVDPKGIIVARNLRGEDLLLTLEEIMERKN